MAERFSELKQLTVGKDGRIIVLVLATDAGLHEIEFDAAKLETLMLDASGALSAVREKAGSLSSLGVVPAAGVIQTMTARSDDGEAVLVGFKTPNGIVHRFALPIDDALKFGKKVRDQAQTKKRPTVRN